MLDRLRIRDEERGPVRRQPARLREARARTGAVEPAFVAIAREHAERPGVQIDRGDLMRSGERDIERATDHREVPWRAQGNAARRDGLCAECAHAERSVPASVETARDLRSMTRTS